MIKLQIIGNLGADAVVKEINGKHVINFNVAHTEKYKDAQGNQKESTTWVECARWTDSTAIAPWLTKGMKVYAEGRPTADAYTDKSNTARATLRMTVDKIELLGSNTAPATAAAGAQKGASPAAGGQTSDEEKLPF